MDETKIIHEALQYLAGVCDGAVKRDECGFNAFDTAFGHQLAMQPGLSQNQAVAALKMLRKYANQLKAAGIVLPDSTGEAEAKPSEVSATISSQGRFLVVRTSSKPSEAARSAMKAIQGWRFGMGAAGNDPMWTFPSTFDNLATLKDIFPGAKLEQAAPLPEKQPEPASAADVIIERHNGEVLVRFPNFETRRALVDQLKTLPERRWMPDEAGKPWAVPNRYAAKLLEMFPKAATDQAVRDLIEQQKELAAMSNKAESNLVIDGLKGQPYPFQLAGVEFLEKAHGRAIIADVMGLGKTIQAIAYLQLHPEKRPVLIVVPASLKINWKKEIAKWLGTGDRVAVVSGTKVFDLSITGAQIVIINWDLISAWQDTIKAWKPALVIYDEAHYAKNTKAQRTKAARVLAKAAKEVICLTGTPITNRPAELWPLLNMVDAKAWPNFMKYAQAFCGAYHNGWGWDFSGASNLDQLHKEIAPYVIRRTKEQVLKDLPPKRRVTVEMEFDDRVRSEYEQAMAKAESMAAMSRAEQLVIIESAKQICARAKLPGVIDWIKNGYVETGEKVVVFATHHETIDRLMDEFGEVAVKVDGRDSLEARQAAVDKFQSDPDTLVFVGNVKAAGVGITLTAASDVAFVEYPWTPGDLEQAADRVHRIGQTESVTVWYLVAEDTIDQDIARLLQDKAAVIGTVIDGSANAMQLDILDAIKERIMAK